MAANPVLVDSSYYIALLRLRRDPLRALAAESMTRDLATCGIIRCEVGRGIRDRGVLRRFQAAWNAMVNVPLDDHLWETVEATVWTLDRQGIVLPLTDVIIACSALRIGATLLTLDKHFSEISGLKVAAEL